MAGSGIISDSGSIRIAEDVFCSISAIVASDTVMGRFY